MAWKPDRLLKAILIWTMVSLIIVWLPLVRGLMDGDSYQWGNSAWGFQFGGRGLGGDYWFLLLQAAFGLLLLYLGWRGARQPFHWLLLLWHIQLALQSIYNSLSSPEDYRFRGDTLGVDVSLAWVGPLLFGGFALLSIWWVVRDIKNAATAGSAAMDSCQSPAAFDCGELASDSIHAPEVWSTTWTRRPGRRDSNDVAVGVNQFGLFPWSPQSRES